LNQLDAQPLPGTEGAALPFWSPGSDFLGFFAGGKLRKISASGGPPIDLCEAPTGRGGTWSRDDVIIFSPNSNAPLYRVSSGGGIPEPVTELKLDEAEWSHRWPHFLPDGRHFLFFIGRTLDTTTNEIGGIYAASLDSRESALILGVSSRMEFAQGYLFFLRQDTLVARPFDPSHLEFQGDAIPITPDVAGTVGIYGGAQFSVTESGLLIYHSGGGAHRESELVWFGREGNRLEAVGEPDEYWNPRLSHDGMRVAASILNPQTTGRYSIWVHDLPRNVRTRFTFEGVDNDAPVWSPDDSTIIFDSARGKSAGTLYKKVTSGRGRAELLFPEDNQTVDIPTDWSPDGQFVLFHRLSAKANTDIWVFNVADEKPVPLYEEKSNESYARFSPDGKWIAYVSDESGRNEIYMQTFPDASGKWQISAKGGRMPAWRADGREIFFLAPDGKLMAVDVKTEPILEVGVPTALFNLPAEGVQEHPYDVTVDGNKFLVITTDQDKSGVATPITLVVNWDADLKK
jgi:hypothetical protein